MEENLREAGEFLRERLEDLKKLNKENRVFFRGRRTAQCVAVTGSSSLILEPVAKLIVIIRKNLEEYGLAKTDTSWMIQGEYITPAQLDAFITSAERIIEADEGAAAEKTA